MNSDRDHAHQDYYQLPLLLDAECALPTRGEEPQYLNRLIQDTELKGRLYSPLSAKSDIRLNRGSAGPGHWDDRSGRHLGSGQAEKREVREYRDILTAFDDVKKATWLGRPGSGKSTTLRKLALQLARRAQDNLTAPLPLLARLDEWKDDATASRVSGVEGGVAIVASCRRQDYTSEVSLMFDTLTLEPLPAESIRPILQQWAADHGKPLDWPTVFSGNWPVTSNWPMS